MDHNEVNIYVINGFENLSHFEINSWILLFSKCFKKSEIVARSVFKKYSLHKEDSYFCFAKRKSEIIAIYSGILFLPDGKKVFLSTDTMSDGTLSYATIKIANFLYQFLKKRNVDIVCGFPNEKILKIRQKKLGWKIISNVNSYFGLPLLWRFKKKINNSKKVWFLKRPSNGFFIKNYKFISLLGRNKLYKQSFFSLVYTISTRKPGTFFIELPKFILPPKKFGYKIIKEDDSLLENWINEASFNIDLNSIDIP